MIRLNLIFCALFFAIFSYSQEIDSKDFLNRTDYVGIETSFYNYFTQRQDSVFST